MPLLTGAITVLSLAGTPGLPYGDTTKTYSESARTYSADFTRLGPGGTAARPYGAFTGKTASTADTKYVTDRYVPVLTFDPVDAVDVDAVDVYVPVIRMSAVAALGATVADTYVPRVTLTVGSLQKSSVTFTGNVADSYVPVLTMSAALSSSIIVTDTYTPVLTFSTPTIGASPVLEVSDTYVPVLSMEYSLDSIVANIRYDMLDTYVPVLTMNAAAAQAGEVDDIHIYERPYGVIRIVEV